MSRYDRRADHPQPTPDLPRSRTLATLSTVATGIVVVLLLAAGVLRMWDPVRWVGVDATTLLYLGIPVVVLHLPRVLHSNLGKLSVGPTGISVELREIREAAASAGEKAQAALASAELSKRVVAERLVVPPGARRGAHAPQRPSLAHARAALQDTAVFPVAPPSAEAPGIPAPAPPAPAVGDPEDPQRGRWGGRAERDGRVLRAKVTPVASDPDWFDVRLWVEPAEGGAPLEGEVVFHLHDTFADQDPVVPVVGGRAELRRLAWGAFTVGAEADGGATTLELDLAALADADAPAAFRAR